MSTSRAASFIVALAAASLASVALQALSNVSATLNPSVGQISAGSAYDLSARAQAPPEQAGISAAGSVHALPVCQFQDNQLAESLAGQIVKEFVGGLSHFNALAADGSAGNTKHLCNACVGIGADLQKLGFRPDMWQQPHYGLSQGDSAEAAMTIDASQRVAPSGEAPDDSESFSKAAGLGELGGIPFVLSAVGKACADSIDYLLPHMQQGTPDNQNSTIGYSLEGSTI